MIEWSLNEMINNYRATAHEKTGSAWTVHFIILV